MTNDYTKPALDLEAQIQLMKSRNMVISCEDSAKQFLKFNNYYRFAGYWKRLAEEKTHVFKNNINNNFDDLVKIYNVDEKIRRILFNGLESFEISFRSQFSHELALKHGAHFHLDEKLFNSYFSANKEILMKEFERCKEKYKSHYLSTYKEELPPIWVTVEFMSLGNLSKWFDCLNFNSDQNLICNNFNYNRKYFSSFVIVAAYLRNCCAHYSILWNNRFTKYPSLPSTYQYIVKRRGFTQQQCLFNFIIILQYVLDQTKNGDNFRKQINDFLAETDATLLKDYGVTNSSLRL